MDEATESDGSFVTRFVLVIRVTILCPPCAIYLKLAYVSVLKDVERKKQELGVPLSHVPYGVHSATKNERVKIFKWLPHFPPGNFWPFNV